MDHITFTGDCRIVMDTVRKVLKHEGINAVGEATMSEFMGTEER